jgi:hypothetical protein
MNNLINNFRKFEFEQQQFEYEKDREYTKAHKL